MRKWIKKSPLHDRWKKDLRAAKRGDREAIERLEEEQHIRLIVVNGKRIGGKE